MSEFIRVHCRYCNQTFLTLVADPTDESLPEKYDLCLKPGGLIDCLAAQRAMQQHDGTLLQANEKNTSSQVQAEDPRLQPDRLSGSSARGVDRYFERLFFARPRGNITFCLFIVVLMLAGMESVPGWGFLGLRLHFGICVLSAAFAGAIAGGYGSALRVPGAFAGGLCGAGGVGSIWVLLSMTDTIPRFVLCVVALVGLLPGLLVYLLFEKTLEKGS
jgi:hypothetical protein